MSPVQVIASDLEKDHYPHSYCSAIVAEYNSEIIGMTLSFPAKYHTITEETQKFYLSNAWITLKPFSPPE
jgi:hypothetical protein